MQRIDEDLELDIDRFLQEQEEEREPEEPDWDLLMEERWLDNGR